MVYNNIAKIMDRLKRPDPITNLAYWELIKNNLKKELEEKKIQKANSALRYKNSKDDLLEIDPKQAQRSLRYEQLVTEEANQYYALIIYLDMLFEAVQEMQSDWVAARNAEAKAQRAYHKMIHDLEEQRKTIITLKEVMQSSSEGELFFIESYQQAINTIKKLQKAS